MRRPKLSASKESSAPGRRRRRRRRALHSSPPALLALLVGTGRAWIEHAIAEKLFVGRREKALEMRVRMVVIRTGYLVLCTGVLISP